MKLVASKTESWCPAESKALVQALADFSVYRSMSHDLSVMRDELMELVKRIWPSAELVEFENKSFRIFLDGGPDRTGAEFVFLEWKPVKKSLAIRGLQ